MLRRLSVTCLLPALLALLAPAAIAAPAAAPTAVAPSATQPACTTGPQCPYRSFADEAGHYRIEFAEPLIRLAAPDGSASFASPDGRFRLELWAVPAGGRRLQPSAPAGSVGADGWRVTYRAGGTTWAVASGFTDAGHVFYERRDLMCGTSLTGFVAVYPADRPSRAVFDGWLRRIRIGAHRCGAS